MDVSHYIPAMSLIVAILAHAAFTLWSAATFRATIVAKMDQLNNSFTRMEKELEVRDKQIAAAWKKIDNHGDRIIRVETKLGLEVHQQEG